MQVNPLVVAQSVTAPLSLTTTVELVWFLGAWLELLAVPSAGARSSCVRLRGGRKALQLAPFLYTYLPRWPLGSRVSWGHISLQPF